MTTLNDMINEVLINMQGYTINQDRTTYLVSPVTTTTSSSVLPTVLAFGSTENIGKGIIEINNELMWVDSYDKVANTATVAPYGRGYLGSTASTHTVDSKVTISPTFPRFVVQRAINDTIEAMGSAIYAVKQTQFTWNAAQNTYELDNLDVQHILSMSWQSVGPSLEWLPIRRYSFDSFPDTAEWGSGSQTVSIYDSIVPGQSVKVVYGTYPTAFTSGTQVFTTQTGLRNSTRDVVIYGAMYRLLANIDPARTSFVSPEADEIDAKRPYNASGNVMRQIFALYTQRLNEEVTALQQEFPARIHYTR